MILTCDVCHTSYHTDAAAIGSGGRQVKCASCGHTWHVEAEGARDPSEPVATSADKSYLRSLRERQVKRSRVAALAAWTLASAASVIVVAGAVVYRDRVVDRWPRLASAYAFAGFEVNRFGVEFEAIERRRELVGTVPVLSVAANVRNTSDRPREAPRVRIGLVDTHGQRLAAFEAEVKPAIIAPGETGRFEAVMENPPADSYTLELRFVPALGPTRLAGQGDNQQGSQP